jgi:hypothetical protein
MAGLRNAATADQADNGLAPGDDHATIIAVLTLVRLAGIGDGSTLIQTPFGQKTHLTAFSCGLLMIITQEPAQSLAALDAPLSIEVTVPRK